MNRRKISEPVRRSDFEAKIEGRAKYVSDLKPEGLYYARTLRSIHPRARILGIRLPELPEGYTSVRVSDIPGINIVPIVLDDQPFLSETLVHYIGQPILLLTGPDPEVLKKLLKEIRVEYEVLPAILTLDEAMAQTGDFIFGTKPTFADYTVIKGDPEAVFRTTSRIIEDTYETGYQEHAYLEPQSMLAWPTPEGILVEASTQCPYYLVDALKQALGWDESRIRVVQQPTGGGFGGKEEFPSIIGVHAALCALKTGHPVRLVYDRREDLTVSTKRHPSRIRIRSFLDEEDTVIARDIDVVTDAGAFAGLSSVVLQRILFSVGGVYDTPHLKIRGRAFATNKIVTGAFRGFGGPQAFFAIETHMDHIARILGVDPLTYKQRHVFRTGAESSTGGRFLSPIHLDELMVQADRISGYSTKPHPTHTADKLSGIGCSVFFHGCGYTGSGETDLLKPKVRLHKTADGAVKIHVSSAEIGQGIQTTLRKIVAETLDIPLEQVIQDYPDSSECPNSGPTVASRSLLIVGHLVETCARELKARWNEGDVDLTRGMDPSEHFQWDNESFRGNAYPDYSWGVDVVSLEVDRLSGQIEVTGLWAVYDIGTPIDSKIVRGQIEGGMMQGLGYALMENLDIVDGKILQDSLEKYLIPTARDFPRIQVELLGFHDGLGPYGSRGLGELPIIGIAPAIASALQDALGQAVTALPLTPEIIRRFLTHET